MIFIFAEESQQISTTVVIHNKILETKHKCDIIPSTLKWGAPGIKSTRDSAYSASHYAENNELFHAFYSSQPFLPMTFLCVQL